jgi:hypothetical protein
MYGQIVLHYIFSTTIAKKVWVDYKTKFLASGIIDTAYHTIGDFILEYLGEF